jgi:hypothetical protein
VFETHLLLSQEASLSLRSGRLRSRTPPTATEGG